MPKLKTDGIEIEVPALCVRDDAAAWAMQGSIRHFLPEIEQQFADKRGSGLSSMMEVAK